MVSLAKTEYKKVMEHNDKRLKSILILGGGTAGWMAAAALTRLTIGSGTRVTVVEAPDIPIVGVGEATIPPIRKFNALIGLDESVLLQKAKATYKLGIEFVDWLETGQRYFHPFGVYGADLVTRYTHHKWLRACTLGEGFDIDELSACALAARSGRFAQAARDPHDPLSTLTSAYHFDAVLYGRALREHAQRMGANRIEGRVEQVVQNGESGFIEAVKLADGQTVEAEFFVDCSGMRALLIGDALASPYLDWSHWLPCDSAVAAPTGNSGQLHPYTRSTARTAGWQWRIPLQHRTGNGYVYSSQFESEGDAEAVFRSGLDSELLDEPRLIRFRTGRRENFWIKNCVALGLSSGFMEPLESTSIHLIQTGITKLIDLFPDRGFSPANIDQYNRLAREEFDSIRDFLILHYYATRRRDTAFWQYVSSMPIPETLEHRIALFRETGRIPLRTIDLFTETSWVAVFLGQGIQPRAWDPLVENIPRDQLLADLNTQRGRLRTALAGLPDHHAQFSGVAEAGAGPVAALT